ncbi:UNVERIFIED_CONTAM: hypothetical protein Sradi_3307300 [Sesamum radiatum]|uniref:Uncharacterized protein n=1 Tax=Sesamum radiatum TaxID=300843 RepID=A0AAW2R2P3_SESRA
MGQLPTMFRWPNLIGREGAPWRGEPHGGSPPENCRPMVEKQQCDRRRSGEAPYFDGSLAMVFGQVTWVFWSSC